MRRRWQSNFRRCMAFLNRCRQNPLSKDKSLLSFLFAAKYPALVRKLLLVDCPPLEDRYVPAIMETRLNRLDINGRKQLYRLIETFNDSEGNDKNIALSQLGAFMERADSFDPLPHAENNEGLSCQADVFQSILGEINELRKSGAFLDFAKNIQCPVLTIHGDYDPHPAEGVEQSLSPLIKNFHSIQLSDCGHKPWFERRARDKFFEVLIESITKADDK
jgi:pimeloyl-ACP methyl ester carboxylesterase